MSAKVTAGDRHSKRMELLRDAHWATRVAFSSVHCGEDGMHTGRPNGCPDDGSECLCECHDEGAAGWRPVPTTVEAETPDYQDAATLREIARRIDDGEQVVRGPAPVRRRNSDELREIADRIAGTPGGGERG